MKRLTAIAVLSLVGVWMLSGVAYAQEWTSKGETKTVNGFQVELITPAAGLMAGESNLAVRMKEAAGGQPVVREFVRVDLAMDEKDSSMNHGSMSNQKPVVAELKPVSSEQGRYEGKVTISDPGDWNVRVFTDSRGVGAPATFKVNAQKAGAVSAPKTGTSTGAAAREASGPNWPLLGGIALLVLAAIAGVVALVKRSSAQPSAPPAPVQETNRA